MHCNDDTMLRLSSAKISAHHVRALGGECCGARRGVRLAGLVVLKLGCVGAGDGGAGDFCGVVSGVTDGGILTPATRHGHRDNKQN